MHEEKVRFLKQYLLQQAIITRLNALAALRPEKQDFFNKKIKNAQALRERIENSIESLPDDILKELLYQKYIFGHTLEEIALILNYSKRHIERLHIKALEKFNI